MARLAPTRRDLLRGAAGAASLLAIRDRAPHRFPAGRYVDIHTHLGQRWGTLGALRAKELLEWMDAREIAQAVVLPLVSPEAWDIPLSTDFVLRETGPYRDRLIPFCSIDPRSIHLAGVEPKRALLERYVEAGAKGFGEHKPGVRIDHPGNVELFQACAELRLPMLLHLDRIRNIDEPGLPGLTRVLEAVPDGTFIAHAQGWWASISGAVTPEMMQTYPKEKVAPGGAIDTLLERFPNLYGDLSAGSGANAIARDPEFGRAFLIRRADQLLFGTDYLRPEQDVPQFELYRGLNLPQEARAKIFRGNARKLLGLE
ncbi:MAG: amidohydrolase [Planctomycetota bacterium]|nr:MAG: amidohydrolase [Planctomycetota bacterium]